MNERLAVKIGKNRREKLFVKGRIEIYSCTQSQLVDLAHHVSTVHSPSHVIRPEKPETTQQVCNRRCRHSGSDQVSRYSGMLPGKPGPDPFLSTVIET